MTPGPRQFLRSDGVRLGLVLGKPLGRTLPQDRLIARETGSASERYAFIRLITCV